MAYFAPTDLTAALELARDSGAKVIAGGTDVYPAACQGQFPEALLDVTRVEGLSDISTSDDGTRIGGAATWSDLIKADLPSAFDGLKQAAREVGSVQIQNAGTVAGNLCNASPAADGMPPLLTLDAEVEVQSVDRGVRRVPLQDFIVGVRKTDLAADELVTAIHVPPQSAGARASFEKLGSRAYLVISITMTAVVLSRNSDGLIDRARVAVGACSPVAQRLPDLEAALIGQCPSDLNINAEHLAALAPIDDVRGTGAFRTDAVAAQIRLAIQKAFA